MTKQLSRVPSIVQLPGGVRLKAVAFRVVEYNDDGSPRKFELLPRGDGARGRGIWFLFADDDAIRTPVPESQR